MAHRTSGALAWIGSKSREDGCLSLWGRAKARDGGVVQTVLTNRLRYEETERLNGYSRILIHCLIAIGITIVEYN